ncbi:hypothetical protein [Pseudarthrobacter sp. SORGH_AS 212]|uniref:hypothetical protein n=1 Tax=Pseudarthrobacter sp. SORGH_AS 212 TaxID=3041777 RepID=UPI0032B882E3
MTDLARMWRDTAVRAALGRAPGENVQMLNPRPLVRVRAGYGRAIATTSTHVLHEWVKAGTYFVRWDEKWQVHRVTPEEWQGEALEGS